MTTQAEKDAKVSVAQGAIDALAAFVAATVPPQTITAFTASPTLVAPGAPVTISWATENAIAALFDGVPVGPTGSVTRAPTTSTSYTLVVKGSAPDISRSVSVTVAVVVPPSRVQMSDAPTTPDDFDGPTWVYANRPLSAPWVRPGGDWRDSADTAHGALHYAISPSIAGLGEVALDVTALAARLLRDNTGFYLHLTKNSCKLAAGNHATLPGPRLHIVTSTGSLNPPCIVDTWLSKSSTKPLGSTPLLDFPAILKFDLTGVTGVVTSATLTLNVSNTYSVPSLFAADYLDPPSLELTGTVTQGIAATVAKDADLASHPSVLIYDNLVSKEYIRASFHGWPSWGPDKPPTLADKVEIIDWPQYGLKAARVWAVTTTPRILAWHHWAEPKSNPPKPWQRDFGNGHEHLFLRYLMCIGEDLATGMNEKGIKLPGMAGMYEWSDSGAVTRPAPPLDGTWEMRLWHTGLSAANPGWHRLATYYYGVEAPPSRYFGNGDPRGPMWTRGYLRVGRVHCIEQEIKLNTLSAEGPANANPNGVIRIWLDGVLVFERTDVKIRGYDRARIQDLPFFNIYHGGLASPKAPFHYDVGGICVATERIGPPKLLSTPTAVVTSPAGITLGKVAASMASGSWAELVSDSIDLVLGVGRTGGGTRLPFTNSMPWDPLRKRIAIIGADHQAQPALCEYDDAGNRWEKRYDCVGSHGFQHVAVNPFTSDIYVRKIADSIGGIRRMNGTKDGVPVARPNYNFSQLATVALMWWSGPFRGAGAQGVLTVYIGEYGSIAVYDPMTDRWLPVLSNMLPGQKGHHHVESAYSAKHNCLIYGGGNPSLDTTPNPVDKQIWRLNADLTKTRMPDAPYHVGISRGMNMVSAANGNILFLGNKEMWSLNPTGVGKWMQLAPPPARLFDPAAHQSVCSVDVSSYGVVCYIDASNRRTPKCRMWVYRPA